MVVVFPHTRPALKPTKMRARSLTKATAGRRLTSRVHAAPTTLQTVSMKFHSHVIRKL